MGDIVLAAVTDVLGRLVVLLPALLPSLLGGAVLGVAFYGSLWWTVYRGLPSPRAASWFMASMVCRTAVALAGIYLVGDGHWERFATCLAGFVTARPLVARLVAWRSRTAPEFDGQRG